MIAICVDTGVLAAAADEHRRNADAVRSSAQEVGAVVRALDWNIAAKNHCDRHIIRLQATMLRHAALLERHAALLSFAESTYQMTELKLAGLAGLPHTVEGLLGTLRDLIVATFGGVLGERILEFSRLFITQGIVVAVARLVGWTLTRSTVDRGEIEERLMDDYLKESLGKLDDDSELNQEAWDKADLQGRKKMLETLGANAAAIFGVSGKVGFFNKEPKNGIVTMGSNSGSGTINLNEWAIKHYSYDELKDTVFHELRHQYQRDAARDPDSFLVDDKTLDTWKDNWKEGHYKTWDKDGKDAYLNQPIDEDAREFEVD